jgi:hypothetical protein
VNAPSPITRAREGSIRGRKKRAFFFFSFFYTRVFFEADRDIAFSSLHMTADLRNRIKRHSAMRKEPLLTQLASRLRLVKKTCSFSQSPERKRFGLISHGAVMEKPPDRPSLARSRGGSPLDTTASGWSEETKLNEPTDAFRSPPRLHDAAFSPRRLWKRILRGMVW